MISAMISDLFFCSCNKYPLSFANETASHTEHSGQAVKIASYMRSHMADRNGFSDMTVTYLLIIAHDLRYDLRSLFLLLQ